MASPDSPPDHPAAWQLTSQRVVRQFAFPDLLRGCIEAMMFAGVFFAAGTVSLDLGFSEMLPAVVPVVLVMLGAMVASGVYRRDIDHSIISLYAHSLYGFFIAAAALIVTVLLFLPAYLDTRFLFFFLFFAFFVSNTIRPLISGTDFNDGGGRRLN